VAVAGQQKGLARLKGRRRGAGPYEEKSGGTQNLGRKRRSFYQKYKKDHEGKKWNFSLRNGSTLKKKAERKKEFFPEEAPTGTP